jgi:molybdopterin molybdotransferase/putative molybdopterin biosynthesis protein
MEFDNITRKEALERLYTRWVPAVKSTKVSIDEAVGLICSQDVLSANTQPVVRASLMDGVAVSSTLFKGGNPDTASLREYRDYVRADTGDDFDDAYDSVIKIEDVTFFDDGGFVLPDDFEVVAGMNIESCGTSLAVGDLLFAKGWKIRPIDVATLVRGGLTSVDVVAPPHVCFIPTGSELVPAGTTPARGQQIDCNSSLARHMLAQMGATVTCLPIVKDRMEELSSALDTALAFADIVIINGGSSKGKEDFNTRLLREQGELLNHGVAAAPGRPLAIAVIAGKPVINVPGPMVACCYAFDWCLRPLIARALGVNPSQHPIVLARLTKPITARPGMEFWTRVEVRKVAGEYEAEPLALNRGNGLYRIGASSGQFITPLEGCSFPAESMIEIELLCDPVFL